jgi:hypothetical protein
MNNSDVCSIAHHLYSKNYQDMIGTSIVIIKVFLAVQRLHMKESDIKRELGRIRQQIGQGNETELVVWTIPNILACSQRPLRDHPRFGGRSPLPPDAKPEVIRWVNRIKALGIHSIICLLEHAQLDRYYYVVG